MAAEGGDIIVRFIYTGAEGERIPDGVTHVTVAGDCTFVLAEAFYRHRNIVEVICHKDVEKIETCAFFNCLHLRRVIMPGVKIVGASAFWRCEALTDVEFGKLEIIGARAFNRCKSLRSINLPLARIVEREAFDECTDLTYVKFGSKLERCDEGVFRNRFSLERITIPLKDGLFTHDNIYIFQGCEQLKHVDLVEGAELHETIAALYLEEWRNDMSDEIDSINQILPDTNSGECDVFNEGDEGGKSRAIQRWIRSVLFKIGHYKAEHQRALDEAASTLELLPLSRDIVMNDMLPFLELPSHTFE